MMNKFTKFSDIKLKEWIRTYELCPSIHLLIKEEEYKEAIEERDKRIEEILKEGC